jgi:chromosome segregation ATPase
MIRPSDWELARLLRDGRAVPLHEEAMRARAAEEALEAKLREAQTELSTVRDREPPWQRSADNLADEVAALVTRGVLDARSGAADALLDYRNPPRTPRADRLAALEAQLRVASADVDALNRACLEGQERERALEAKLREAEEELRRLRLGDGGMQRIVASYRSLARALKIDPSPANAERVRDEAAAAAALRAEIRSERDEARLRAEKAESELREAEGRAEAAEAIITESIAALGGDYSPHEVPSAIKETFALADKLEQERDEAHDTLAEQLTRRAAP